jgi:hypothetical protein
LVMIELALTAVSNCAFNRQSGAPRRSLPTFACVCE